jgi:hypothetical protein
MHSAIEFLGKNESSSLVGSKPGDKLMGMNQIASQKGNDLGVSLVLQII